jgi:hypothetical protein
MGHVALSHDTMVHVQISTADARGRLAHNDDFGRPQLWNLRRDDADRVGLAFLEHGTHGLVAGFRRQSHGR